ncbi:MAG: hypothetical protein U9N72_06510 [Bacteroidota bacterium]|nr:hypothetical protein [Bacteroidota bacterium]
MATRRHSTDYEALRLYCEKNSRISERVLDDFLLAFAARHHGLGKKMIQHFAKYRHVTSRLEKADVEMFESQFIIHKVFREGGLIEKFLRHPDVDYFRGEERDFLLRALEVPWRFSFAQIKGEPAEDFFLMSDVFSGEAYLLYSPGMSRIKAMGNILLWFNLTGFNGSCWQSYGPIAAYQCFEPGDVFFFATEKNIEIEDEAEIYTDVEADPLPYMLLITGAAYPRTFHGEDEVIYLMAEYDLESLDTAKLRKSFKSEFDSGVYRFSSDTSEFHPHFARIYFDENEKILLFTAMTETGFQNLVRDFNAFGYAYPDTPYLRVRPQMVVTAEPILKTKIILNEYEGLFHEDIDPGVAEELDKMNAFVKLVLDDINAGLKPDIDAAVRQTGVSRETAEDMVNMLMEKRKPVLFPDQQIKEEKNPPVESLNKVNKRSEPLWEIYYNANIIREMEPWKKLYETDIFGVMMPGSKRVWFISVMGANGEYTALAVYKGYEGLFGFSEFQNNAGTMPVGTLFTIPHIMLSFTGREELEKEHLEAIKKSGVKFRGKGNWPLLEEIVPGYMPVFPEGEALEDLPVLLEEIAAFLPWAMDNPDRLFREGESGEELLVRIPSGKQGNRQWKNRYEFPDPEMATKKYKMTYRPDTCERVSELEMRRMILQVDLIILPAPVKEKGKKGYFPFILLLVDGETGMVAGMTMLTPIPDLDALYESVPQKLMEEIVNLGYRPEQIELRGEFLWGLAEGALKKAMCIPVRVEDMPLLDEAVESLIENMMR